MISGHCMRDLWAGAGDKVGKHSGNVSGYMRFHEDMLLEYSYWCLIGMLNASSECDGCIHSLA